MSAEQTKKITKSVIFLAQAFLDADL